MSKQNTAEGVSTWITGEMLLLGRVADMAEEEKARIAKGAQSAVAAVEQCIDFSVFDSSPAQFYQVLESLARPQSGHE